MIGEVSNSGKEQIDEMRMYLETTHEVSVQRGSGRGSSRHKSNSSGEGNGLRPSTRNRPVLSKGRESKPKIDTGHRLMTQDYIVCMVLPGSPLCNSISGPGCAVLTRDRNHGLIVAIMTAI